MRIFIFITFISTILTNQYLFGQESQSFIEKKLPKVKNGSEALVFSMQYKSTGTVSYGDWCVIRISKMDTIVTAKLSSSSKPDITTTLSEKLIQELIKLESVYEQNQDKYEGWISCWVIKISCGKKIRCFHDQLNEIIKIMEQDAISH